MKKIILGLVTVCLIISGSSISKTNSEPAFIIAVLNFKDATGSAEFKHLRIALPEIIATNLAQTNGITVLERDRVQKILKEHGLIMAGVTRGDEKKIGKLLAAKQLLSGTVVKAGKRLRVDVRLTDIRTGKIIIAAKHQCRTIDEIIDAADILSERVVKRITGQDIAFTKDIEASTTPIMVKGKLVDLEILRQNSYFPANTDESFFLRVGFYAKKIEIKKKRLPLNISIVLDRSGSMSDSGKLDYAKKAIQFIIKNLSSTDTMSLVTYDDRVNVLIPPRKVTNKQKMNDLVAGISPGGSTNLSGGMLEGFNQVKSTMSSGQVNRVLLISDGIANVGITDPVRIQQITKRYSGEGITMSTFGVGQYYNEKLLTGIAEYGNAYYYYIDKSDKIPEIFSRELSGLLAVVAQNCSISLVPRERTQIKMVYGYKFEKTEKATVIKLGDLVSEEKKLVLIRIQPARKSRGKHTVTSVRFTYDDAITTKGRVKNKKDIALIYTNDKKLIRNNANTAMIKDVEMFVSSEMMEETMDLVDRGDYKQARIKINDNLNRVKKNLSRYSSREMKKQALNIIEYQVKLDDMQSTPTENKSESYQKMQKAGRASQYMLRKRR